MITITWKDLQTEKKRIQIFKSRDKVISTLQQLKYQKENAETGYYILTRKEKNKSIKEVVFGMSYETEDEKAILQRFHLLPSKEDYPNAN